MNNAEKIGQQLKEWRLSKGVTLETISTNTRININTLRKIEDGRFKDLPSFTYTRGFIKNYLRLLNKDLTPEFADEIKKAYEELELLTSSKFHVLDKEDSHLRELEDLSLHTLKKLFNLKFLIFIISIIVISVGVYFFKHINLHNLNLYSSYFEIDSHKNEETDAKAQSSKIEDVLATSVSQDSPISATTTPLTTTQPTLPPATSTAESTLGTESTPSENFPYIGFRKIRDLGIKAVEESDLLNNELIFPQNFRDLKPTNSDENILFVHAFTGDAWISYKSDNSLIKSYTLKLGEKIIIRGKQIFFSTGNINALRIFHNSKYVQSDQPTSVKNFIFPTALASQHSLPLFAANKLGEVFFYQDYIKKMMPKPKVIPTEQVTPAGN